MKFYFLKSRAFLIIALLLTALLVYVNGQMYKTNKNKDFVSLKKAFQEEQAENQKLSQLKEYLATDIYLERQARQKFKLQKPGEKLIVIQEIDQEPGKTEQNQNLANFVKWWHYLISY